MVIVLPFIVFTGGCMVTQVEGGGVMVESGGQEIRSGGLTVEGGENDVE